MTHDDEAGVKVKSPGYRYKTFNSKKRRKRCKADGKSITENDMITSIEMARQLLMDSQFYVELKESLQKHLSAHSASVVDIVCYGIGSIESSIRSRYQLAFALLLRELLQITGILYAYDPLLGQVDFNTFNYYDIKLIGVNEESIHQMILMLSRGQRVISQPTLFFMPHCPLSLYNNVLSANWEKRRLEQLIVVGNRFDFYEESLLTSTLKNKAPYVSRSQVSVRNAHTLGVLPSILILVLAFGIGAASVYWALDSLLSAETKSVLRFPRTLGDVKALHTGLSNADDAVLVLCYIAVYIFLQSFAIPGSVMLSVLGGTLWGTWKALALVGFCSATGATICYFLSYYLGQSVTRVYLAERMEQWNEQLKNHKQHLFSYIVFLRVTPFLPNWFINIASPHMNVGINTFYWATFFGVMPLSFIHVQAGETIHRITETDDFTFLTPQNVLTMTMIAVAALIPIIIRRKFEQKDKAE